METTPPNSQESYGGGSLEGYGGSGSESGGGSNSEGSENPFLLHRIKTPSPQPALSYDEMKTLLMEYDILRSDDISIRDDRERSVYTFKQDGETKVLKIGNKASRDDTTKYKLLKKEHAIYQQLDALTPDQRAYFPKLYDGGDLGEMMFFLLIEYVEGQVLTDYITEKKSSPSPVKILIELAKALEALRSINLVHGDLSTENILVTQDSIKLIDFEKTGPHDTRVNVRGSETLQIGFLYIMSKLLPKGPVYTSLEEEMRSCNDCDSFYTTAIEKLSSLTQGGGARKGKAKTKGKKTRKAKGKKPKAKGSRRLRLKGN